MVDDDGVEIRPIVGRARGGNERGPGQPQPHGGTLYPFPPRNDTSGFKRTRREAFRLLNEGTPAAAQRMLELAASEDERVAAVATAQILDRTLGRAGDTPQGEEARSRIDLAVLTTEERTEIVAALAVVRRLRDTALARAGAAPRGLPAPDQ
jgi:hypothetical protein